MHRVSAVCISVAAAAGFLATIAMASSATAGGREPPDVVLVITDDQRAGTLQHMPQLRKLLTHRGVRFRSAFVPNPSCCPSRASFYTGAYSHTNGVWKNQGPFGGMQAFDD